MSILILVFYLVIILYFISLGSITLLLQFSETAGIIAFTFLIAFFVVILIKKEFLIDGKNTSALKVVSILKDNSILIISLFLLFTLYKGFTIVGVLPKIYTDEFPQTYFELVNKAESGRELPAQGKYKYEDFKEKYDQFIEQSK